MNTPEQVTVTQADRARAVNWIDHNLGLAEQLMRSSVKAGNLRDNFMAHDARQALKIAKAAIAAEAESAKAIAELVEGLVLLLTPLERASHAMIAAGKVPDENAEATFDRARALIAKHGGGRPCRYCQNGQYTGLPGNACENCMNTGIEH